MRIDFRGQLVDEPVVRAGFIGCGSHAFRNVYPALQFAPIELVAVCDLQKEKAEAFARRFGATHAYSDHRQMLARDDLDAVFIVTNYRQDNGRPRYPELAVDCLEAGRHVWIEKPPAATCADIERMQAAATRAGKNVVVGFKKMFMPAAEKAKELISAPEFGGITAATLQYPQGVPDATDLVAYLKGENRQGGRGFLDHCHPMSLLVFLLGMPTTLFYRRGPDGTTIALFGFASGAVASLLLAPKWSSNGGLERTVVVSAKGGQVVIDNNYRLSYHRTPQGLGYGGSPSYFVGPPEQATAVWEPEHSLGQLYNKQIMIQGFYNEVNEFARSILDKRKPAKGTLRQAWEVTRIFEAFAEGPNREIALSAAPKEME